MLAPSVSEYEMLVALAAYPTNHSQPKRTQEANSHRITPRRIWCRYEALGRVSLFAQMKFWKLGSFSVSAVLVARMVFSKFKLRKLWDNINPPKEILLFQTRGKISSLWLYYSYTHLPASENFLRLPALLDRCGIPSGLGLMIREPKQTGSTHWRNGENLTNAELPSAAWLITPLYNLRNRPVKTRSALPLLYKS